AAGANPRNIFETFSGATIDLIPSVAGTFNQFLDPVDLLQGGAGSNPIRINHQDTVSASTPLQLGNVRFGTSGAGTGNLTITSRQGINQALATTPIITSGVVTFTLDQNANQDFMLAGQANALGSAINTAAFALTGAATVRDFELRNTVAGTNAIDLSALPLGTGIMRNVSLI